MRKKISLFVVFFLTLGFSTMASQKQLESLGRLVEFKIIDIRGDERNVQVFVPFNVHYESPTRVVWYFRGTNGILLTWNIETSRLYMTGHKEKAIIVAPDLVQKTWSKGSDETDYYLVRDIIERLKTLEDKMGRPLTLDLENILAIGFSAGGGFIFHLAGRYLLTFNETPFLKFIDHARSLDVRILEDGSLVGNEFDVQAVRDMVAAYEIYPEKRPPFLVSVGDHDMVGGAPHIEYMKMTNELLAKLGFETSFHLVPGLHHKFIVDFTPDFYKIVNGFLFPLRVTKPQELSHWRYIPGKEFTIEWTSALSREKRINIDLFSREEDNPLEIARDIADSGSFTTPLDELPLKTGMYYCRLTSGDSRDIAYSGIFKIIVDPLTLTLQVSLIKDRAWIIKRYYGEINLLVEHIETGGPVATFRFYRKESKGEYAVIKEIPVEDMVHCQCSFLDKYLKSSETYFYKAEAIDINGTVLASSPETNLLPPRFEVPVKVPRPLSAAPVKRENK